jgi:two-component system LytT family sensor kinase
LIWQRVVYFYIDNPWNRFLFSAFDVGQVILAFYVIFYFITPHFFSKKNKLLFIVGFLASIVICGFILALVMNIFLQRNIIPIRFNFSWQYNDMIANRYFIALLGATAGFITKLSLDWMDVKRKMELVEREKMAAELIYLKAQINPHFLFNAINTIYIQMDVSKEDAKETLNNFSQMLRYQLYECDEEKVPIEKELQYIRNYIRLQSLRKDERYEIDLSYGKDLNGFRLAPFILLPFIENMFKYVSNNDDRTNFIRATLTKEQEWLVFHCINSKDKDEDQNEHNGIGLTNVKRRLALIYPGKHLLNINRTGTTFEVWLKIMINE